MYVFQSQNAQWAAAQVPAQPSLQTSYQRHTASTSTQPTTTARTPYNNYPYGADRQQYPVEQQFNQPYMGQTMNGGYAQQRAPPPYNYVYQSQPPISAYGDPPLHSVSQSGRTQQARPPPVAVPNSTTQTTNRGYSSRVDNKSRPQATTRIAASSLQSRGIPSGNQTTALSQSQTASSSTRGVASVSRQQSNGETGQKVQGAMHYTSTNGEDLTAIR